MLALTYCYFLCWPARIVVVGSVGYQSAALNLDDLNMEKGTSLGFSSLRPYFNSKLCNMLFARELSKRLEGQDVNVYTLCPGLVDTGLVEAFPVHNVFALVLWGMLPIFGCTPEQVSRREIFHRFPWLNFLQVCLPV